MSSISLPPTMKALILPEAGKALELQTVPTPVPVHGSVVIKVIASGLNSSMAFQYSRNGTFSFPKDTVPGGRAIGRVASLGPDTTSLEVGQLVLVEPFIRARDNPDDLQILFGLYDGGSPTGRKFTTDNWSKASSAEYCMSPLENTYSLDEKRLCGSPTTGGLGYDPCDLLQLTWQLVAYGGFREIGLQVGETMVVAPATGSYTGAAVQVAVSMGANVIAMSRNMTELNRLLATQPAGRVKIVQNTGNVDADTQALQKHGPIDAFTDITPWNAGDSTHIRSCFMAVKPYGIF
ncbi:GroES-like protein [Pleurostoma richardsiae]|uniref:GroES-like protein n=1 Tax=Pleurostoma richardsiae TaxID=41990 RepID=A0AA38S5K7_9PEZI|nr:GroES-like protein [Pleurostoma richardsiae]